MPRLRVLKGASPYLSGVEKLANRGKRTLCMKMALAEMQDRDVSSGTGQRR